jgi:hypothetical protein
MKNSKVVLAIWVQDHYDLFLNIPWPIVHQQIGSDAIQWLKKQGEDRVQMIYEKNSMLPATCTLTAEFYDKICRQEFALRFAK